MDLTIFDVEHGSCALLTTDASTRMLIDCGHNATKGWTPGLHLQRLGVQVLDWLAITNYDEDHVSGFVDLEHRVRVAWMLRNMSVDGATMRALKSETGIGPNMDRLADRVGDFHPSSDPRPNMPGVTFEIYNNIWPTFDDENNLSMVLVLRIAGTVFIFPGDLECDGWDQLLADQPGLRAAVAQADVLVASHHGRESGICDDMFCRYGCKPAIVVISDDCHRYDTQRTTGYYGGKAKGIHFRGQQRYVLTTRSDGQIRFTFPADGFCYVT